MKLLVVTQYFWPENFRINDLVAELTARGHEITVLTGKPNYPDGVVFPDFAKDPAGFERFYGAEIIRVPMRERKTGGFALMLNYLSFAVAGSIFGALKLRGRKFDAIFVFEPSPITVGIPAIIIKWLTKAPIAFWVLDLWPQSLAAVGAVKSPLVLGLVDRLVRFIYRSCDIILVQSQSFIPEVAKHVADIASIRYFPSWADSVTTSENVEPAAEVETRGDTFNIVFAGNIGEAQDFPAILNTAEKLRDEPVRWLIVGDGRKAAWVKSEIDRRSLSQNISMLGRFPLERMPSFFQHASALLVSLRAEPIFALTIPGKLQSYLAAGIPVLAMLDGEGGKVVDAAKAGFAVPAGDSDSLAGAVRQLMRATDAERLEMGVQGRLYSAQEFDRTTLISRLEQWLADLAAKNAGHRS